jgi:hypothetical protein
MQCLVCRLDPRAGLRVFDVEASAFEPELTEAPVTFPPSYPYEERVDAPTQFLHKRCPAWCDRVLYSPSARGTVEPASYLQVGCAVCMGDHKVRCFASPGQRSPSRGLSLSLCV